MIDIDLVSLLDEPAIRMSDSGAALAVRIDGNMKKKPAVRSDNGIGSRFLSQYHVELSHLREFAAMRPGEHVFGYIMICIVAIATWFASGNPWIVGALLLYVFVDAAYLTFAANPPENPTRSQYVTIFGLNMLSECLIVGAAVALASNENVSMILIGLVGLHGLALYNLTRHSKLSLLTFWDMLLFGVAIALICRHHVIHTDVLAEQLALITASLTAMAYYGFSMLDSVRARESLERSHREQVQRNRLAAIGQMTAGVAHDFNNILAVIQSNLDVISTIVGDGKTKDPDILEHVDEAGRSLGNGTALTQSLLSFSRQAQLKHNSFNINELVAHVMQWTSRLMPKNIVVSQHLAATEMYVMADATATENAILNLMLNAADAQPDGGGIQVTTREIDLSEPLTTETGDKLKPGKYVQLSIVDEGPGIPSGIARQVFEPFFTTKGTGKGSGLGLAMVYGFMKQSGGAVVLERCRSGGASFSLYFPAAEAPVKTTERQKLAPARKKDKKPRILLVEDNSQLRKVVKTLLLRHDFKVTSADSGDAAWALFQSDNFDLVLTDVKMPGNLDGFSLAANIRAKKPNQAILFMSGYADDMAVSHETDRSNFLTKPVKYGDLLEAIDRVLDNPGEPTGETSISELPGRSTTGHSVRQVSSEALTTTGAEQP